VNEEKKKKKKKISRTLLLEMAETLSLRGSRVFVCGRSVGFDVCFAGVLKGHEGWVTCIATSSELKDKILTGSRDKALIVW
jgi:hypothetical protein